MADAGDGGDIVPVEAKIGPDAAGGLGEEAQAAVALGRGRRIDPGADGVGFGQAHAGHEVKLLPLDAQPDAARGQNAHAGGGGQDVGRQRRPAVVEQLLHVVQNEQGPAVAQVVEQLLARFAFALAKAQTDGFGHGRHHPRRRVEVGQGDEEHAVGKAIRLALGQRSRGLNGQPRLADAARPDERHQPRLGRGQQRQNVVHFLPATDEAGRWLGQVDPRRGHAQRREVGRQVGGDELEDPLRLRQIAQPVLPQRAQGDTVRQATVQERRGHAGEQHLAAMTGRHETRGAVEGRAVVVTLAQFGRARVDAHAGAYQ